MGGNGQPKIFLTVNQLSKEIGLPRNQIIKDIKSGRLPAMKRGKSYYIYSTDSSKYIYDLVCEARGLDDNRKETLEFLAGVDPIILTKVLSQVEGGILNDKSKDKS